MIGSTLKQQATEFVESLHNQATSDKSAFIQKYEEFKPILIVFLNIVKIFLPSQVGLMISAIIEILEEN